MPNCNWVRRYNPKTKSFVNVCNRRRRKRSSRRSLLGDIGNLPTTMGEATNLKSMFADVKGVVVNGAVAVAGAVLSDKVFSYVMQSVDKNNQITGMKRHAAEMAVGLALGMAVGKILKKPRIAVLIAIGPVVVAGMKMVGELLNSGPFAGHVAGLSGYRPNLGMMAIEPYRESFAGGLPAHQNQGNLAGMQQIGTGVPSWMTAPELSDVSSLGQF